MLDIIFLLLVFNNNLTIIWFFDSPSSATKTMPISLTNSIYRVVCTFQGDYQCYRQYYSPFISDKTVSSFYVAKSDVGTSGQGTITGIDFLIIGS